MQLALYWDASLTAVHALTDVALTDDRAVREAYRTAGQRNAPNLREELACVDGLRSSVVVEEGPIAAATLDASYGLGGGLSFLSPPDPRQLLAALKVSRALQLRVERVLQEEKRRAKDILDRAGIGRIDAIAGRLLAGGAWTTAGFATERYALDFCCR